MKLLRQYFLTREVFFNLFMFLMWGSMLLAYMRGFIGFLPVLGNYQKEVEAILVICILVAALPSILNRVAIIDWAFLLGCAGFYILNLGVFHDNYDVLIEKMFPVLCTTIPFFLFGRMLDIKAFIKPMTTISTVCVLMDALYFLIYMRNPAQMAERMAGEYYMAQAYRLLPHVLLLGWRGMKELNIWRFLLSILGMFLILAYGSRGPLACLGIFYIICFFAFTEFRHAIWIKGTIITLCGLGLVFIQPILIFMQETLSSLNMSTRIIERMLAGGLTHDTGRGFIKLRMYEYLDNSDSFWGYGLFGCKRFGIIYPHDYVLDFFFPYGYFIGTILLLFTSYLMLKALMLARSHMEREFIVMCLCMTVLKYQFSATYIEEGMYFAFLGYCTTVLINHRQDVRLPSAGHTGATVPATRIHDAHTT